MAKKAQKCPESGNTFWTETRPDRTKGGWLCIVTYIQDNGVERTISEWCESREQMGKTFRSLFRDVDKLYTGGCALTKLIRHNRNKGEQK